MTFKGRGKPLFIRHRTAAEIEAFVIILNDVVQRLYTISSLNRESTIKLYDKVMYHKNLSSHLCTVVSIIKMSVRACNDNAVGFF